MNNLNRITTGKTSKPEEVFASSKEPVVPRVLRCYLHAGHRTQDTGHRTQNAEHRTENTKRRTQNTKCRTQNKEHRTQNTKCRTQDSEHKTQNTKRRTQNKEHRTQNAYWLPLSVMQQAELRRWFLVIKKIEEK